MLAGRIEELTTESIDTIFMAYDQGCYDHLLKFPRTHATDQQKRAALAAFMVIMADDDIRGESLRDTTNLVRTMEDQFFQEPLFHLLNAICHVFGGAAGIRNAIVGNGNVFINSSLRLGR